MRKELELIERIEHYLLNQMSGTEKIAFESELKQDITLQNNVDFQQNLMLAIKQVGLKKTAKKAGKTYTLKKVLRQTGFSVLVLGAISAGAYYFLNGELDEPIDNSVEINRVIAFPENDTLSADANKYLDQEVFEIDLTKDTVIETEDGVVVQIPAGAFDTESESIDLVLQTAVQPDDVLKAGLSTTSNGEDLETGGMFYIDAFDEDKRVNLKKDLTVDVPSGDKKPGMQLYEGVKLPNGEVDWVKPKPVETFLTSVDIEGLDFYPPGYESTLTNWGLYGKAFRDSLYYSFAFDDSGMDFCEKFLQMGPPQRKITVSERDFLYGDDRPIDRMMTREEAKRLCESGMLNRDRVSHIGDPVIGELLFNGNCASCHFPDRDMTGPSLAGARERWNSNSTEENFYKWIKNSTALIATGDSYAKQLEGFSPSVMTPQAVTNEQIDHIFAYIELVNYTKNGITAIAPLLGGGSDLMEFDSLDSILYPELLEQSESDDLLGESGVIYDSAGNFVSAWASAAAVTEPDTLSYDSPLTITGVNPANVQTIWNSAFNKTNLSTKEFEERMPWIHKSCETNVLNIYVENLDKPLYYSDSIAAGIAYGESGLKFEEFAKRRDGRVSGSQEGMALYAYYEKKRKANIAAVQTTQTDFWNDQDQKDTHHSSEENSSENRTSVNKAAIFQKEFQANLEKAKKDLGIASSVPQANSSSYTATVSTLGWKNIDRPVMDITANRETGTVSYEGKEAEIKYESWSASIANFADYDKVNVYNIPKTFNSYIKIKGDKGNYKYNLNTNLKYQTLVLAWTENSIFFYQDKETNAGEHPITLKPITMDEFKNNVAANLTPVANMEAELKYVEFAQKDQVRINNNKRKVQLREKIMPVIFPCMRFSDGFETVASAIPVGHHGSDHPKTCSFSFDSTPLAEAITEISECYDRKITYPESHSKLSLTCEFNSVPIEEIIDVIVLISDLTAEYQADVVILLPSSSAEL